MALGTLAVLSGQQSNRIATGAAQTLPVVRFDIPVGTVEFALQAFEKTSGWKVEIPDAGMLRLPTKQVSGVMPLFIGAALPLRISQESPDHPSAIQLTGVYHNLVRMWAEL